MLNVNISSLIGTKPASHNMAATTLATFGTTETADCVEACPIDGFERSLVVATYQLHKADANHAADADAPDAELASDRRCGTLQHFLLAHDQESVSVIKAEELETSSGVFDIKWASHALGGKALLASATAGGTLELYEIAETESGAHRLKHTGIASEGDPSSMCLSLDWSNRVIPNQEPTICVSHSDGCVCHLAGCIDTPCALMTNLYFLGHHRSALSVWNVSQSGVTSSAKVRMQCD